MISPNRSTDNNTQSDDDDRMSKASVTDGKPPARPAWQDWDTETSMSSRVGETTKRPKQILVFSSKHTHVRMPKSNRNC